jgi:hypothetical protein
LSLLVLDHTPIIERIIAILQADKTIYNKLAPKGKLRKILFAEPDQDHLDDSTPYCYVNVPARFQFTREPIGTMRNDFSMAMTEYQITVVAQKKDVGSTHKELFAFLDKIVRALKANTKLGTPGAITTDEKASRSEVLRIERKFPQGGKSLDGFRITLGVIIGYEWEVNFPTLGGGLTIPLLSKPVDTIGVQSDTDICDDGELIETKIADPGLLEVEFEEAKAVRSTLETQIDLGTTVAVNVNRNGALDFTRTVFLKEIRNPTQFDTIERRVLSMKIIS